MDSSLQPIRIPTVRISQDVLDGMAKGQEFNRGFANVLYEQLMVQIAEFEKELNQDEEIAAYLASFGKEIIIQIEAISFSDPYFIIFEGSVNNSPVRLVQHVSQLNVLFTSINVKELNRPPRRFGFVPSNKGENK